MQMFFDPMYFIILAPALLLGLWAQIRVKSAYHKGQSVPVRSGLTGAEAARRILDRNGLRSVQIELSHGMMSDHYDTRHKVLRLSPDVAHGRTAAALGIAAHEAGHALQDAQRYTPLVIRNGIVPLAQVGSNLSMILFIAGLALSLSPLVWLAVAAFGLTVVFQLVNLPVEYDASRRAKQALAEAGMVSPDEEGAVRSVLSAAALTYVAATLTAVFTLVYFLLRASGGNRG